MNLIDGGKGHPVSPLGPVKVAVTVDDLLLFRNIGMAPGHSAGGTTRSLMNALAAHSLSGIYQFSNTLKLDDDPDLSEVFDLWVEGGHHVGNHTHHHPSINWLAADAYARDIERSERLIGRYIDAAPRRCFRFCMDMWGDTQCKCDEITKFVADSGYFPIPVSANFHDFRWHAAHTRVVKYGRSDDLAALHDDYVESALRQLRIHAANARAVFGRDVALVWLIHGTPIAGECLERILDAFVAHGVQFVSLDEAMRDRANAEMPPRISPEFIFQIEKWALALGVPVNDRHPGILEEIEKLFPREGEAQIDIVRRMRANIEECFGVEAGAFPLSPDQH